ncbi:MAG: glutamine-hydrolyzing carbamoyl-phosphate synthase small subunit [Trueperaceae bacterium]|nr:MAG: glutamine-hydrolyzing carbamoyl-phosphate synthase small subunit [Trueperaceae bacterium]
MTLLNKPPAALILEDGTVYYGYAFGYVGTTVGEVVFNTAITGYQEILTDPSYHGQIVTMTYPHIGNYGVSVYDMESNKPFARGFIVREFSRVASNYRSNQGLQSFMEQHKIVGIEGIDTRALTRRLRTGGVVKGVIFHGRVDKALQEALSQKARNHEDIDGRDMTPEVTTSLPYARPTFRNSPRVVLIDFGIKHSIVYKLEQAGAEVIVVPAQTTPAQIMALNPFGLVLSNGPGDPGGPQYAHDTVWQLLGLLPTYGICMGHQLLGLAVGGRTYKLKHGHHGANTPVKNLVTGEVEITSQNHNYAVDVDSIPGHQFEATHINLNDGTLEGMAHLRYPVFSVQYHPEASPGPHDASYLFKRFIEEVNAFEGARAIPAVQGVSRL